jgi:hypothetical protein
MREAVHTFDTHQYIKSFKKTGMKEVQAEAIITAIKESRDFDFSRLATKDQIKLLQSDIKTVEQKIETSEERLRGEIKEVEVKIKASEATVIKWVFAGLVPLMGLLIHIAMRLPN